jgi:uncharacterized membrane protein (UPF0127 family)
MIQIKTASAPWRLITALTLVWLAGPAQAQDAAQPRLPTLPLTAGMHVIQAEIARTMTQQMVGMMHRTTMGTNEGMLFVYDEPQVHCFWMRNTRLPLTIAFIADDGRIVNLADMKPFDESSHCAAEPVRFALEMNQGWFAKRGLKPGFRLQGSPFKP